MRLVAVIIDGILGIIGIPCTSVIRRQLGLFACDLIGSAPRVAGAVRHPVVGGIEDIVVGIVAGIGRIGSVHARRIAAVLYRVFLHDRQLRLGRSGLCHSLCLRRRFLRFADSRLLGDLKHRGGDRRDRTRQQQKRQHKGSQLHDHLSHILFLIRKVYEEKPVFITKAGTVKTAPA